MSELIRAFHLCRYLAIGGKDQFVHVYDDKKGELAQSFKGHRGTVSALAFRECLPCSKSTARFGYAVCGREVGGLPLCALACVAWLLVMLKGCAMLQKKHVCAHANQKSKDIGLH